MSEPLFNDLFSKLGFAYEEGYTELLALIKDAPRETKITGDASMIRPQDIIVASSFNLNYKQQSANDKRYIGEGADSATFLVNGAEIRATFKMPLYAPSTGFVNPAVAALWDQARLAYWGTATAAVGQLIDTANTGSQILKIDNIADFSAMQTPFNAYLMGPEDGSEDTEQVIVLSVDKAARTVTLTDPTQYAHSSRSALVVRPYIGGDNSPAREPAWSLFSLREGMLSPCLVDKITIEANADGNVEITVEVAALRLYRDRQIQMSQYRDSLLDALANMAPVRTVEGMAVVLSPVAAHAGEFGLATAIGSTLFGGYQTHKIAPMLVKGFSITVSNNLREIYTAHSKNTNYVQRQQENSFPWALHSDGRSIHGIIKYVAPIEPWQVAERLSGPSSLTEGGLKVDYGCFSLQIPEIAWSPSSSTSGAEGDYSRTLEWSMVAETLNAMPIMEYSQQD